MLPLRLKLCLIVAIVFFFVIVLLLLKYRRLTLKYSLLWFFTGASLFILVLFPGIIQVIAGIGGFQSSMNALYIILIAFLIMLSIMLTSIVSKQTERIRSLAQQNALLEQRLRILEDKIGSGTSDTDEMESQA